MKQRFRFLRLPLASAALCLSFVQTASAQDAPAPPRARMDVSVPEPPAPVVRTVRQHEGFYLRANLGIGALGASSDVGGNSSDTRGLNMGVEALVGGSPGPGFSLGGAVSFSSQLTGNWDGGDEGAGDLNALMIGPFADGYPNQLGGWHFGGTGGLVVLSSDAYDDVFGRALGFGGAGWVGYDVWVAPEWSVGGQFRLDAMRATASDDDLDLTLSRLGLSLQFSVVYN